MQETKSSTQEGRLNSITGRKPTKSVWIKIFVTANGNKKRQILPEPKYWLCPQHCTLQITRNEEGSDEQAYSTCRTERHGRKLLAKRSTSVGRLNHILGQLLINVVRIETYKRQTLRQIRAAKHPVELFPSVKRTIPFGAVPSQPPGHQSSRNKRSSKCWRWI